MPNKNRIEETGSDKPSDLPSLQLPDSPAGSPPRQHPPLNTQEVEHCMANLTLAHEIVINGDFRFKQNDPPKDSLEGRVKAVVHQAFWDSLQDQLSRSPPNYNHAIILLQEVKDTLLSLLLPGHVRLRAQLDEVLDMALIHQQAEHGALDLCQLSAYVISTMASLCAPVRDPEIRCLQTLSEPVDLLREMLRVLDLMKMDMVNFTVQSLRPHLLQQAVQYERSKFQAILDRQPGSLDNTTAWLQGAVQELKSENQGHAMVPPGGGSSLVPVSPSAALNRAYIRLLSWETDSMLYPETVQMDRARLDLLGQAEQSLVLEAAILLVTNTQCGGTVFSGPGFVGKLKHVINALVEGCHKRSFDLNGALLAVGEQVYKLVNENLVTQGRPSLPPERESMLKAQISGLAKDQDPVHTVVAGRVQSYLQAVLGTSITQRAPPVPPALTLVADELVTLGVAFGHIVQFNCQVFGPYYSSILKRLIFPQGEQEMGMDTR